MWMQNAEFARRAALGFESLVADALDSSGGLLRRQRLSTREDKNYDLPCIRSSIWSPRWIRGSSRPTGLARFSCPSRLPVDRIGPIKRFRCWSVVHPAIEPVGVPARHRLRLRVEPPRLQSRGRLVRTCIADSGRADHLAAIDCGLDGAERRDRAAARQLGNRC